MNLSIVGRHFDLTDSIKDTIKSTVEDFKKFHLDIIAVKAILEKDKHNQMKVEFNIQVAHRDTIVVVQKHEDLYAAIEIAKDRVEKILRRYHDKIKDHHNKEVNKGEVPFLVLDQEMEDEIIEHDLDIEKPVSIDDAVDILKASDQLFMVFEDLDGNKRVIFKRKDGKVGIY